MCLSVCYLFVSPVSSPVAWWLAGSFSLIRLPTSAFLSQWLFVCMRCKWSRCCILRLRRFLIIIFRGHLFVWRGLLFVILYSFYVKIVCDLLSKHLFVFELPEWIHGPFNAVFVFFFRAILIKHLVACFLFQCVPLLLKFSFEFSLKHRIQWMLWWHPCFFRTPIWHTIT